MHKRWSSSLTNLQIVQEQKLLHVLVPKQMWTVSADILVKGTRWSVRLKGNLSYINVPQSNMLSSKPVVTLGPSHLRCYLLPNLNWKYHVFWKIMRMTGTKWTLRQKKKVHIANTIFFPQFSTPTDPVWNRPGIIFIISCTVIKCVSTLSKQINHITTKPCLVISSNWWKLSNVLVYQTLLSKPVFFNPSGHLKGAGGCWKRSSKEGGDQMKLGGIECCYSSLHPLH